MQGPSICRNNYALLNVLAGPVSFSKYEDVAKHSQRYSVHISYNNNTDCHVCEIDQSLTRIKLVKPVSWVITVNMSFWASCTLEQDLVIVPLIVMLLCSLHQMTSAADLHYVNK